VHFFLKFALCYAIAIGIWSIANSTSIREAGVIALTYGIFALPFGLATAGLAHLLELRIGSLGVFVAVILVFLAFHLVARNRPNAAESNSAIPYALIFAVVWSVTSW
jgi:hypothetical protein